MSQSKQVIVCGAKGRMGQQIIQALHNFEKQKSSQSSDRTTPILELWGATVKSTEDLQLQEAYHQMFFGRSIHFSDSILGLFSGINPDDLNLKSAVVIDFTTPAVTLQNLTASKALRIPIVIGTTGLNSEAVEQIKSASKSIPICFAPNMSFGMNVLFKLVEKAAHILGDYFDVEVIEAHHRLKKDAPSGTAMKIAEILLKALDRSPKDLCFHREGMIGERKQKEIGMQTLRGGDIVGDHTVLFAGIGEILEIRHQATDRSNFARGAIIAAKWLTNQPAGLYDMQDVLGLR